MCVLCKGTEMSPSSEIGGRQAGRLTVRVSPSLDEGKSGSFSFVIMFEGGRKTSEGYCQRRSAHC